MHALSLRLNQQQSINYPHSRDQMYIVLDGVMCVHLSARTQSAAHLQFIHEIIICVADAFGRLSATHALHSEQHYAFTVRANRWHPKHRDVRV